MAERPTPHSIAVCTLIALLSDPSSPFREGGSTEDDERVAEGEVLSLVLNCRSSSSSSAPPHWPKREAVAVRANDDDDVKYREGDSVATAAAASELHPPYSDPSSEPPLCLLLRRLPRVCASVLLDDLGQSSESVDSMHDLFDALRSSVSSSGGPVDAESARGVYVRRRCLGFDGMGFEAACRLWEAFRTYVERGRREWQGGGEDGDGDGYGGAERFGKEGASRGMMEEDDGHGKRFEKDGRDIHPEFGGRCTSAEIAEEKLDDAVKFQRDVEDAKLWPPTASSVDKALRALCSSSSSSSGQNAALSSFESSELAIRSVLSLYPELPSAHFLRFLRCLESGERVGALESLHRYFDYAVIFERKGAVARLASSPDPSSDGSGGAGAAAASDSVRPDAQRNLVQYAPILLALLYHKFGRNDLALKATEEAIRIAQRGGDGTALSYALGWLALLRDGGGGSMSLAVSGDDGRLFAAADRERLWARCAVRAAERGLPGLAAGASLSLAFGRRSVAAAATATDSNALSFSSRGRPSGHAAAWDAVASASCPDVRSCAPSLPGQMMRPPLPAAGAGSRGASSNLPSSSSREGAARADWPTNINSVRDGAEALTILGRQRLVGSIVWDGAGCADMAKLQAHISLLCHGDAAVVGEVEGAASSVLSGYDLAVAALNIASGAIHGGTVQGRRSPLPFSSSFRSGRVKSVGGGSCAYADALRTLADLRRANPSMDPDVWRRGVLVILCEWSVRRGRLAEVRSQGLALRSDVPPDAMPSTAEERLEVMAQVSLLLLRQRRWEEAKDVALRCVDAASTSQPLLPPTCRGRNLLRLAQIYLDANPRGQGALCALPHVLECLSLSELACLDSLHASALVVMGRAHLQMGEPGRARSVVQAALPSLERNGHLWFRAGARLILAKCQMMDAKAANFKEDGVFQEEVRQLLKSAILRLAEAERLFARLQDVMMLAEVYYLQAQAFHLVGRGMKGSLRRRDAAAECFCRMNRKLVEGVKPGWYDAVSRLSSPKSLAQMANIIEKGSL